MLFNKLKHRLAVKTGNQRGATSVEYAVTLIFTIIILLVIVLILADPTGSVSDSVLPRGYNAIGSQIGQFGTVDSLSETN